jgi:hypothetical protein
VPAATLQDRETLVEMAYITATIPLVEVVVQEGQEVMVAQQDVLTLI